MTKRILVARAADATNLNAQAKNSQHILRHWQSKTYRPSILGFGAPDAGVAANPNVDIVYLPDNRLWRAALFGTYMRHFDGIFYPGIHHYADWLALRTRQTTCRRVPLITTMESLVGLASEDSIDQWYAGIASHKVYCGGLPPAQFQRYEQICELSDHIIAISPFLARMATARFGNKVSVLPLGVDTTLFRRVSFERCQRPRVVGIGTVYARKRPEVFLNFAEKFPEADFVWFGEGNLRQVLLAEISKRQMKNVEFPGALPPNQLAKELTASDIFVLPSFAEGVPKVTQEAAAAGLAQIIFGFYEAPSVVDGENGFVVWSDDELTGRLARLLSDPDLRERMGRAGQCMARDWSWELIAPKWEKQIIDVCAGQTN
jgi:glycosyltransferase involved in cell wall biosynthesis